MSTKFVPTLGQLSANAFALFNGASALVLVGVYFLHRYSRYKSNADRLKIRCLPVIHRDQPKKGRRCFSGRSGNPIVVICSQMADNKTLEQTPPTAGAPPLLSQGTHPFFRRIRCRFTIGVVAQCYVRTQAPCGQLCKRKSLLS